MTDMTKDRVEQLIDYIMKKCLWQFHSRNWDRERQNKGVLGMTTQILCEEPCDIEDPKEKCYWVDAVVLAEAYRERFPWINTLSKDEIRALMAAVHARLDHLTITGSLNEELTDKNY